MTPDIPDDTVSPAEMSSHPSVPLVQLDLKEISYSIEHQSKTKEILSNITTTVEPYHLTAWMGPSGAGKSTLVAIAAHYTKHTTGTMQVNGETGELPKRLVGMVWQDDLLLSNLTVYENIYYIARLKTSEHNPQKLDHNIRRVITDLGLQDVQNSLLQSISGGERKRTSVAAELIGRPSVLLLDEPTSGLDATTSIQLVQTLQQLTLHGHAIVMVIHQPRTAIFRLVQHLLLLSQGRMVYNGPPKQVRSYFEPLVGDLPAETGIADWIMDVIKEDEARDEPFLAKKWQERLKQEHPNSLDDTNPRSNTLSSIRELEASVPRYHTSFATQFWLLTIRTLKQQRGVRLTRMAIYLQICYLIFTSSFWWQLPNTTAWIFERTSLLFFMVIAQANGTVLSAVTVFQREGALLQRERDRKLYGVSSYFLAKTVSDMTANVLLPVCYGLAVYWTAGFRPTAVAYFQFALAFYLTLSTAQSMGLWISIIIPSLPLALALAPPLTLFFMIIGGFYIRFDNMPDWIAWSSWLSFARYGYSALVINEFQGRSISCDGNEPESFCPVSGDSVLADLGITGVASGFWFNIGMVCVLQVMFRCAAYIALRRRR